MSGYDGFGDNDELLSSEFFESDLETYFKIKNVEVKEYDIVQLKGLPHKVIFLECFQMKLFIFTGIIIRIGL